MSALAPEVEAQLRRLEELNDRVGLALLRQAIADVADALLVGSQPAPTTPIAEPREVRRRARPPA